MCYPMFDISRKLKVPIKTDHAQSESLIVSIGVCAQCPPMPFSIMYRAPSDLSTLWGIEATAVNQVTFIQAAYKVPTRILPKYLQ
jgi:hypothetical protein